ncbi:hypothetical protein, variant 2 [Aphanomyces invadans]|uniref:Succinylglutamate desuccinylase/Aspartoacylase catalytic domain-containing protein n=1 Tax=Aphanomyces invadans TaxID=157072 RepID=A0A024TEN4_9STRA|nr:hypothetical protein, variant 2 [Aphanomyces invadans]ETV91807.1 hypothetical protein, variant 2 [Aphanomyces invadans]|eukprot:XP_008879445.1 hypothetical protein, variant 2 [Aphanomyces invadans]
MATFREIGHCIWQAVGSVPTGKHVTVLGGVHGNELTGVHVVEWLKKRCPPLLSGTLTLILGNPKAIELNQRGSAPHADLNRCFTMSVLDSSSTDSSQPYEQARAREIAPFLQQSDLVLDLHATNKPSEPFLKMAGPLTPQHYAVGRWFPCNVLLHDPLYILAGGIALTDEYTGAHGGVGMIFESGIAGDTSRAELVFESVIRILANEMSMVAGPPVHAAPTPPNTVFEITEVGLLQHQHITTPCPRSFGFPRLGLSGPTVTAPPILNTCLLTTSSGRSATQSSRCLTSRTLCFPKSRRCGKLGRPWGGWPSEFA